MQEVETAKPTTFVADVPIEQMYRVPDVAAKLGMSPDWTLRYFQAQDSIVSIPSPPKRGKRKYCTHLIPHSALMDAVRKLSKPR